MQQDQCWVVCWGLFLPRIGSTYEFSCADPITILLAEVHEKLHRTSAAVLLDGQSMPEACRNRSHNGAGFEIF